MPPASIICTPTSAPTPQKSHACADASADRPSASPATAPKNSINRSPSTLAARSPKVAFAVAVSSFGRSQLWRWTDYEHWDKVRVVHCGVDETFLEEIDPPAVKENSRSFCCVGRLAEQKGQLVLVRAAGLLRREGLDFHIDLVGEGPMRPVLEAEIARLDLAGHVTLHGLASGDAVRQHMLDARATVLPSFAEGLPVVLMESLALARPCVATTVAGIPELATPDNGWLVPPGDAEGLAAAMREVLLADASELATKGLTGRARVQERHDASREAVVLSKFIEEAGAGTGGTSRGAP